MKIKFLGAAGTVTGSCYRVDTGEIKFLVDCGMFQGSKEIKERNYGEFAFEPNELDFVLLTHAHIDHSGLIPKLYKHGFSGNVYTTEVTRELCSIVLPDCGHIQEMEVERKNRKLKRSGEQLLEPIYTAEEGSSCLKYFKGVVYDEKISINDSITVRFRDAGHILGSAMIEIWIGKEKPLKILFSGDIGNTNQPIVENPENIDRANYVIMESTYGNRVHGENGNKREQLEDVIKKTAEKGGNLVIPAFAVERTQDLLYHLGRLEEEGKLYGMDIVIDSPMAISTTEVFNKYPQYYDEEAKKLIKENDGANPIMPKSLSIARSTEESMALNEIEGGKIIISASGMADAGRIKHHLKHNLWRDNASVLFVGYQAPGTLGSRLLDGVETVRIHGEEIMVSAELFAVKGFSAHADLPGLLKWVKGFKDRPDKIFITHGEKNSADNLAEKINEETGIETVVPSWMDEVDLKIKEIISADTSKESINAGYVLELHEKLQTRLSKLLKKGLQNKEYEETAEILNNIIKNYLQ